MDDFIYHTTGVVPESWENRPENRHKVNYDWLNGRKAKITSITVGPGFKESVSMEFVPESGKPKVEPEPVYKDGVIVGRKYASGVQICEEAYKNGWDDKMYLKFPTSYGMDYCLGYGQPYDIVVNKQTAKDIEKFGNDHLTAFIAEIIEMSHELRLIRTKEKLFKKIMEEVGEYVVASLGEKQVTESPREELVDVIICALSLYAIEGGSLEHLKEYGNKKLKKAKQKLGV